MRASGLVARRSSGNPGYGIVLRARSAPGQPDADWLARHRLPNEGSLTQKTRTGGSDRLPGAVPAMEFLVAPMGSGSLSSRTRTATVRSPKPSHV